MLAAIAAIGLGLVLGPEAPLLALGGGLGTLAIRLVRRDAPPQVVDGDRLRRGPLRPSRSSSSSPLIARGAPHRGDAGSAGERLQLVLVPGLLAAGIGSLVSLGLGSWTGLSTSDYALGALVLPAFARPDIADFAWTIPLAVAVAVGVFVIVQTRLRPRCLTRTALPVPAGRGARGSRPGDRILGGDGQVRRPSAVLGTGRPRRPWWTARAPGRSPRSRC